MQSTTNYNLPTYEGTDSPNLINGYNSAMAAIDTQMKNNADAIAGLVGLEPSQFDDDFDVSKLANAKVDANGIVYIPQTNSNL